jgi:pSer/pThr/pTyr-binding forkhead associated (FHA) protein
MPENNENNEKTETDENRTIYSDSSLGQRLFKVRSPGTMFIVFKGRNVPITSRITVGRGADNKIGLDDTLASRHHAVIQKIGDDFFVKDLNSTNGTFVNTRAVPPGKYVRLLPDDIILIGRTELSLRRMQSPSP